MEGVPRVETACWACWERGAMNCGALIFWWRGGAWAWAWAVSPSWLEELMMDVDGRICVVLFMCCYVLFLGCCSILEMC